MQKNNIKQALNIVGEICFKCTRNQQNIYCLTDESVESGGGQRGSIRVKLATVNFALVARHEHDGSLQAGGARGTL